MDANHTEASLCFPTFPRFCGQTFLEQPDKELALACVQAYNDWMIDEWCGGAGCGRLIPLTLIPLWDPELAAAEVRRCAAKGSPRRGVLREPRRLGLPSIFTDHWDPLFAGVRGDRHRRQHAHRFVVDVPDDVARRAPRRVAGADVRGLGTRALSTGSRQRRARPRSRVSVALSEGQVGWMPFMLEQLDGVWHDRADYGDIERPCRKPPSSYVPAGSSAASSTTRSASSCATASASARSCSRSTTRTATRPGRTRSPSVEKLVAAAGLDDDETHAFVRGNAISCYGLDRYGIAV